MAKKNANGRYSAIVVKISELSGISPDSISIVLDCYSKCIIDGLLEKDGFQLGEIGKLKVTDKKAGIVRVPFTKETRWAEASKRLRLIPSKKMKDKLNEHRP